MLKAACKSLTFVKENSQMNVVCLCPHVKYVRDQMLIFYAYQAMEVVAITTAINRLF